MQKVCRTIIALQSQANHIGKFLWELIRGHGNHAGTSYGKEGEGQCVVAGKDEKIRGSMLNDFHALFHTSGSFFNSNDILTCDCQPQGGFGENVAGSTAGNVVDDYRFIGRRSDRAVMLINSFL